MPSSEQHFSTFYGFAMPRAEANQTVLRFVLTHGEKRFELEPDLAGVLRGLGVHVVAETVVEPASGPNEAFHAAVEGFHQDLAPELVGSVVLSARGVALVETPTRLGQAEHRRRRALVERFLRTHGIAFTTECRVVFSEDACQPLPLALLAPEAGAVEA